MENKNQQFKGFGQIYDAHVSIESPSLQLYVKFDSKEKIYQLKYTSNLNNLCKIMSDNYDFLCSLSVSSIDSLFSHNYGGDASISDKNYIMRQVAIAFKEYVGNPGALIDQDSAVEKNILCHCTKLSYNSFKKEFIKNRGNVKETIYSTMATSFCDSCEAPVNSFLKVLESENQYFLGEEKDIWIKRINKAIDEFYLFCPPEYNNLSLKVATLKFNKIIIKCEKADSSLKRSEIQATLENFLTSEIDFKEEVIFSIIT